MSVDELDYQHDARSNSIGALLAHIAAAEVGYQAATFHGRDLNEEERQEWGAAVDLGDRGRREIRGRELDYYLSRLQVRAKTLAEVGRRNDQWLDHVLGHEINHRWQISWLRTRATRRA